MLFSMSNVICNIKHCVKASFARSGGIIPKGIYGKKSICPDKFSITPPRFARRG